MRKCLSLRIFVIFQLFILFLLFLSGCVSHQDTTYEQAQESYAQRNYYRAFSQLWIPVQHNDPRAMYAMGYMYYYGIGTEKDQDIGRSLIRRAADKHYSPAIIALKQITQRRYDQYVPFENYDSSAVREGIWKIKRPLIRGKKV